MHVDIVTQAGTVYFSVSGKSEALQSLIHTVQFLTEYSNMKRHLNHTFSFPRNSYLSLENSFNTLFPQPHPPIHTS